MKLTTILISTFLGLSAALPSLDREASPSSLEKRVIGWFPAAVIGGVVSPVISRIATKILGGTSKRSGESWAETRRNFIHSAVQGIFDEDENRQSDAAVCTGVGYSISSPSRTVDLYSFALGEGTEKREYDCFILTGPSTFTVDPTTADTEIAVKVGSNGKFENGVLTLI